MVVSEKNANMRNISIPACSEAAHFWWQWHPPVGVFIAMLALLGVLVPLFRLYVLSLEEPKLAAALFQSNDDVLFFCVLAG